MRRKRRQSSRVFGKQEVNYGKETGFRKLFREDTRNLEEGQRNQRGKGYPKDSSFLERVKPAP